MLDEFNLLRPGDFIFITDSDGNKRVEIVQQITDTELITIGLADDAPIAKSIKEVERLDSPLYRKSYKLGDDCVFKVSMQPDSIQAQWIDLNEKWEEWGHLFKCSNCGHKDYWGYYCSNCGARMVSKNE